MSAVCRPPKNKESLPTRGIRSSSEIWMKEKAERDSELWDNRQGLWIVQNKVYDLRLFAEKHPGGRQWIELTKGQDVTEHFVTHHLFEEKARKVLSKFYVRDVTPAQPLRFTFEEGGLYRVVKQRVLKEFKPQNLQNWNKSVIEGTILIIISTIIFILSSHFSSFLLAMVCGVSFFPLLGVAHNFIHMRWHPFRYLWLVTGFTHQEWQRMHCLSHHSFSNTLLDYEIQAVEPLAYYLRVLPENTLLKWIIKELFSPLATLFNIFLKIVIVPIQHRKQPEWFYLVPLLQLIPLSWMAGWQTGWRLFLVMHLSCSFIFFKVTFLGHRTGREWTQGNEQIRDFGHHQVVASSDTKTEDISGMISYICYAGFNFHAIHHMFPTVDNHYLPALDKILTEQASRLAIRRNIIPSLWSGLFDLQSNFISRTQWSATN